MIELVESSAGLRLADYDSFPELREGVRALRTEASMLRSMLRGRTVWMVNSTAQGGGVAEMLPQMVALLDEVGVRTRWAVIGTERQEFFALTKTIHNLIHGAGSATLDESARALYETVNRENAEDLVRYVAPDDIVVIHDPQPMGMGPILKEELGVRTIWCCHIGLDTHTEATRTAWHFLQPYAAAYDRAVFSAPEYIPDFMAGRATIIHPAIDPCSHKNRELRAHRVAGILCNAGLMPHTDVLTPDFEEPVQRLTPDGTFRPVGGCEDLGLIQRPLVTQVSRWDRLKGFAQLLDAFVLLKRRLQDPALDISELHRRRLELVRLVLAGPDPSSIQDDPEGLGVLEELTSRYLELVPEHQADVALLTLPMGSRKENALVVNALQRCSSVVVQNSLQEGFGLTATEAMWKNVGVLGSRACGLRQQIRAGIDGLLVQDAENPEEIARRLDDLLKDVPKRETMARSARRRVYDDFLIFSQLCSWVRLLAD